MAEIVLRELGRADGEAMRAIDLRCPLVADWTLQLDRGPDVFRWVDEAFSAWRYLGAEVGGQLVGFGLVARAGGWFYAGDARVLPEFRGQGVVRAIAAGLEARVWPDLDDGLGIVKLGNRGGERVAAWLARRPVFPMRAVGALEVVAIPALRRIDADPGIDVRPAVAGDAEEVVATVTRLLGGRLFAPHVLPGRVAEGWWVARRAGRIVGVLEAVDLAGKHGMRVLRFSGAGALLRTALSVVSRIRSDVRPPPGPGEALAAWTTSTVAVEDAATLRALLAAIPRAQHHVVEVAFVGDDDPLRAAVRGLWGVSVRSTIFRAHRAGRPERDGRPYIDLARI